jgi:probable rRNA maturation factor
MPRTIAVTFLPGTRGRLPAPELRRIARTVLDSESVATAVEAGIVLADDATVRDLNRLYRGKDEETDVLSFAAHEGEAFLDSPDEGPSLGEVVISVPFVERQVAGRREQGTRNKEQGTGRDNDQPPAAGITVQGQIAHLLVHGLLHLIGLDHEQGEAEEEAMRAREESLLAALGYEGRYEHGH